ncbi:MAG TPA: carboxypeptidase regulatory-like domain-containing protein, partial [Bryobacteraceae bacterium]|nr:carboxypeptidase regulatory-like domain-containing protein [Bryobacteraceae bacterium]
MRALRSGALLAALAAPLGAQVSVIGRVIDENGRAVPGARVEFRTAARPQAPFSTSDVQGRFRLELDEPGEYSIRAQKEGFFVLEGARTLLATGPNEVSVTLNHLQELTESIDVVYSPPAIDPAQTSDQKQLNSMEILAIPYPASQDVRSALPMFSGVVQGARGSVHFNGGASDQVSYTLDDFNIADPATGGLEARVSIDAVRSLDLESGRFSAGTGRGSAGSLNLGTGMGDDRYRFGGTNFVPSVSTQRGLVLSKWTPRLTVSGPVVRGRAWFHNGFDAFYDVDTIPELPRGEDRSRNLTTSNLSRVQVNLTPANILTGSYLINYIDSDYQGLSFLSPRETTLHRRRSLNMATVKDQIYSAGGVLLEIGFAAARGVVRDSPQGTRTYVFAPSGRGGNYFVDLARHTDRQQWLAGLFLPAFEARGSHRLRAGVDLQRSGFGQAVARHDYLVLRNDETVARRVSFIGDGRLSKRNFESAVYVQDSWTPRDGLLLELGLRMDWDQIVRTVLVSPRVAASWSPSFLKDTKLAAGFGVFGDALNMQTLTMHQDQSSLTSFYSRDGLPMGRVQRLGFVSDETSLKVPRARIYSGSVERMLPRGFYGKISYLRRAGWHGFTFVEPPGDPRQTQLDYALSNRRSDRYDALELSTRRTFAGRFEWVASYTYSRARSNAVIDYSLENPVFSHQASGPREWDTPHRFLTWGWAPVPSGWSPRLFHPLLRELDASYLVETRSGFPFSVVTEENVMAGR